MEWEASQKEKARQIEAAEKRLLAAKQVHHEAKDAAADPNRRTSTMVAARTQVLAGDGAKRAATVAVRPSAAPAKAQNVFAGGK